MTDIRLYAAAAFIGFTFGVLATNIALKELITFPNEITVIVK